jgi:hypothetical protein
MNVVVDHEALEEARKSLGKSSYSETIDHLATKAARRAKLMQAIDALAAGPDPWYPGFVDEVAPDVAEWLRNNEGPQVTRVADAPIKSRRRDPR